MSTSTVVRSDPAAFDDQQGTSSITGVGTMGSIAVTGTFVIPVSFRTPPGLVGYITKFGQAWDPGLDTFVRYSLRINGGIPSGYNQLSVQISSPSSDIELPTPIRVEQFSLIEVVAFSLTGATFPGNFFARVVAKYYNP